MKYNDNGLWKTLNVKVTDTLPVGTIMPYAGATIPSNYMKCEGQELSRIEYDILFSAIGTTYGAGDGTTTFNLPNLKGRIITGVDSNDTDFDVLGETGGEKTHTLTVDEMPSHYHGIRDTIDMNTLAGQNRSVVVGGGETWNPGDPALSNNTGDNQPHNNLQPYIVLNYIIKVLDAPATGIRSETLPVGTVIDYEGNTIPVGWEEIDNPDSYSTSEVKTNKVWIDGKPIYRKVIARNQSITNGTSISVSSLNIDELIKIGAINQNQSNNFKFFGDYYDSSNEKINIHLNNNDIQVWSGTGVNYTSTIWVEYTKTTD